MKSFKSIFPLFFIAQIAVASQTGPWDLDRLFEQPEWKETGTAAQPGLTGILYSSIPYKGNPVEVFAYYGAPEGTPPKGGWPAVVCVHGGGGTAFNEWVQLWNDHGYAAISMDLEGHYPIREKEERGSPRISTPHPGPSRVGIFNDFEEPIDEQWYYHAVSQVILAHSLIRSFPEVNPEKTGVTGISWGGTLTSTIMGVDNRFKFAIPVYGCGYLPESDGNQGEAIKPGLHTEVVNKYYDGSAYFENVEIPTLWVNGTNDKHFPMPSVQKSSQAVRGNATLRIELEMRHGHGPGWAPEEIYAFADSIVKKGKSLVQFDKPMIIGPRAQVRYTSTTKLDKAEFLYTKDTTAWPIRKWVAIPATWDGSTISAPVPVGATAVYFNATDERGLMTSSEYIPVEQDAEACDISHYPEFSWDRVPRYMHMRKSDAFTDEEFAYLSKFPIITLEKTTGQGTYGSTELGSREAAKGIKAINPNAKVLYYRNVIVHYSGYDVNDSIDAIGQPLLVDASGNAMIVHGGKRGAYDLTNPDLQEWWLKHCVEMAGHPEIDGLFIDGNIKALEPAYLNREVGKEKKAQVARAYDHLMKDLDEGVGDDKLLVANLIRARLPNSGLDYLEHFDGSYIEAFESEANGLSKLEYVAQGIAAVQEAARSGKIICFSMGLGKAMDVGLKIDDSRMKLEEGSAVQDRLTYSLAVFLICAEKYSYFLAHDGYSVNGNDSAVWLKDFPEYDKPLGKPLGPALQKGYIYTREFEHASVWLDIGNETARIEWNSEIRESDFSKSLVSGKFILPAEEGWWTWCMAPIYDEAGKLHIFNSAIPRKGNWTIDSEIRHYVADSVEGPYRYIDTPFKSDTATYHNPQISKVGDTYVLVYLWKSSSTENRAQEIGIATAKSLYGPWTESPHNPILRASGEMDGANILHASNPTFLVDPDGKYRIYYKSMTDKYLPATHREISLAISDNIEGPYVNYSGNPLISYADEKLDIEDPYAFHYKGTYYMIVEDRRAVKNMLEGNPLPASEIKSGGNRPGLIYTSDDGIKWSRPEIGYQTNEYYFGHELARTERPHILWKDGKPEYLFLACHDDDPTAGFYLKIDGWEGSVD